jgi:hypothetical protein
VQTGFPAGDHILALGASDDGFVFAAANATHFEVYHFEYDEMFADSTFGTAGRTWPAITIKVKNKD